MKSRLLLIPMILATTAALGEPADGQARAAALLSRPQSIGTEQNDSVSSPSLASPSIDGQAKAAALLSRPSTESAAPTHVTVVLPSHTWMSADGQTQAAALLNRPRTI